MKRAIVAILAISWFLAILYFWRARPPLVTVVAESKADRLCLMGFDDDGNVVLARLPEISSRRRTTSFVPRGPLTLHSPVTGRQLQTLMAGDELIRQVRIDAGLVLTDVPGAMRVRAFGQDKPLVEAEADISKGVELLSPNGSRLLTRSRSTVTVYDVQSGRSLWSKDEIKQAAWAGDSAVAIEGLTNPIVTSIVDAQTGEMRLTVGVGFPEPHEGELSPSGQYVWWAGAAFSDDPPGLYDLTTGKRLWGLEHPSVNQFTAVQSRYFFFNEDSSELQVLYVTHGDLFAVAKWRVRDGEAIHAAPKDALLLVNQYRATKSLSDDGRWLCTEISKPLLDRKGVSELISKLLLKAVKLSPHLLRLFSMLYEPRPHVRITDLESGEIAAEVPQMSRVVTVEPDNKGFIFHGGTAVTRMDLPPRKDYGWLVRYGVLPPAVLIGVLEIRWWRRRRAVARGKAGAAVEQQVPQW
jgi:hypothetical protein